MVWLGESLGKDYMITRAFPFRLNEAERSEEIASRTMPPPRTSSFPVETVESRIKPESDGLAAILHFTKQKAH